MSKMLKGVMDTTRAGDLDNDYARELLTGFKAAGIDFISTVMMVTRPFCVYPWVRDEWYRPFWTHLDILVDICNEIGMGLQLDLFNEPSLRHGNPLCLPIADPNLVRKTPAGYWAKWVKEYINMAVVPLNRLKFGAILYVLEGTGSAPFEKFCHEVACEAGLKPEIRIISNSVKNYPGVIYSPHVHSLNAVKKFSKPGAYCSDDGWYPLDEVKLAKAAGIAKSRGCAAYETLLGGCLSGEQPLDANGEPAGGHVDYDKRRRPAIAQLKKGIVGRMVQALGRG